MYVQYKALQEKSASNTRASTPSARGSLPPPAPRALSRSASTSSVTFEGTSEPVDGSEAGVDGADKIAKRFWKFVDKNLEDIYQECRASASGPQAQSQYKANLSA